MSTHDKKIKRSSNIHYMGIRMSKIKFWCKGQNRNKVIGVVHRKGYPRDTNRSK